MNDTMNKNSEQTPGTSIRSAGVQRRSLMRRWFARRGDGESGQALIEFSYVAPVLLLVTFGMCLFGIAFNQYLTLNNAVEIGGQLLAAERGETGGTGEVADPCTGATQAAENAAPNMTLASSATWTYNINGTPYSGTSCSTGQSKMLAGGYATMTISYPLSFNVPFLGNKSYTLTASVEEVIQ
jgi:Flp pilus assembly protein TadG